MKPNKMRLERNGGFAPVLVVVIVLVLFLVGYLLYSNQTNDGDLMVRQSTNVENTISGSDEPDVIIEEFEETDLMLDKFDKELEILQSELETI